MAPISSDKAEVGEHLRDEYGVKALLASAGDGSCALCKAHQQGFVNHSSNVRCQMDKLMRKPFSFLDKKYIHC